MRDIYTLHDEALLNTKEVATWIGVSVRTIEGWRRDAPDRLPPHLGLGRTIRYRVRDVRAFLIAGVAKSSATSDKRFSDKKD